MTEKPLEFGIIGLGNIGGNLARQALGKGLRVVGHERHEPDPALVDAGLEAAASVEALCAKLAPPRRVFLYVPAGAVVDELLAELTQHLQKGDVVADGGNSYWGDSGRRHDRLKKHGLHFVDLGTSGGLPGARSGACFMAGGEPEAVALVEPILAKLSVAGGYVHAGPPGAGHFVKLVHNGIEFGMLQAIAEGVDLLHHYPRALPVAEVLRAWSHGSVIRSWLIELLEQAYREMGGLEGVPGYVEDTGEVNWLLTDALQLEVAIPVISQSVSQLIQSRDGDRNAPRAIAMMRHGFGNHPFGPSEKVAEYRATSRVGGFWAEGDPDA
jgi:6-phosphogluconate dehydrogenase